MHLLLEGLRLQNQFRILGLRLQNHTKIDITATALYLLISFDFAASAPERGVKCLNNTTMTPNSTPRY